MSPVTGNRKYTSAACVRAHARAHTHGGWNLRPPGRFAIDSALTPSRFFGRSWVAEAAATPVMPAPLALAAGLLAEVDGAVVTVAGRHHARLRHAEPAVSCTLAWPEAGLITPITMDLPAATDASAAVQRARDGFALIVGLRWPDHHGQPVPTGAESEHRPKQASPRDHVAARSARVRGCANCGRSIDDRRRHARYCGGPCRAAASRARAAQRVSGTAPAPEPTAPAEAGHDGAKGATWALATPAVAGEAEPLASQVP